MKIFIICHRRRLLSLRRRKYNRHSRQRLQLQIEYNLALHTEHPHSPDADDYDAFGFILSRGNCRTEESLKHSVAEEAAPKNKKASLIPLTSPMSPISMHRGDSYISDDSSSSDSLSSHSHGQIRTNAMVEGALREHEPAKTQNSRRRVVNDHSFSSSDSSSHGVEHHALHMLPLSNYNQYSNSGPGLVDREDEHKGQASKALCLIPAATF